MLKSYKELKVWKKAYALCLLAYKFTATFPNDERFGLISQIRRSAVSVPSNIAEGYGRKTRADYIRMLYIAYGSICELETQALIAVDLGYLGKDKQAPIIDSITEVERMLKALIKALGTKSADS